MLLIVNMVKLIHNIFSKVSNFRTLFLSFLAVLLGSYFILYSPFAFSEESIKKVSGGVGVLDLTFGYSAGYAYDILSKLGSSGREHYIYFLIADSPWFPLTYLAFTSIFLYLIYKKFNNKTILTALLPFLAASMDYLENIFYFISISSFPTRYDFVLILGSLVTSLKLIFTALIYLAIVVGLIVLVLQKVLRLSKSK